jgi:hypothetical protein
MKTKLFILSFIVLTFGSLQAHVITVSNNAVNAGHFTKIQTAADSVNVDDTIYVMGSPTDYGNVYIKTRCTIIGAGYAVTGTQNNWASIVDYVYLDSIAFQNPVSGTKIMGLDVNSSIQISSTGALNNIDIERCYVNSWIYVGGTNWTIRNNDIDYINCQNNANIYIQNNFIYGIVTSNQTTVIIDHNNFVDNSSNIFWYNDIHNALITNNVFYYGNPQYGCYSCTFSNNITSYGSVVSLNTYAGNTGAGNIFATPPGWTDATIPASTVGQNTIWNYKWTFKAGSPAHNAATDGTDIGVYGGSYPMPNLTGATRIPQMTLMNVSGIVPAGGSINVNFKARDQK